MLNAHDRKKLIHPMAIMTRTWVGVSSCGIPLMSISFMLALMLSSVAMVSLENKFRIM